MSEDCFVIIFILGEMRKDVKDLAEASFAFGYNKINTMLQNKHTLLQNHLKKFLMQVRVTNVALIHMFGLFVEILPAVQC